ncbi:MAG: DNA polymerase III subunit delta' [Deltaproteobacteria bacterium]|nr:DNA polymerase III subunit delta' [Deltaproteobacteria bacterium]
MSFEGIYGQDKQLAVLRRSMDKGRIPHALLFHGMRGIGKRTTALAFAKTLLCDRLDACGLCPACRKVESGNHPDVVVIVPQGQFIKIEDIRDLRNQMRFRPLEGRKRIIILVDAERMNIASANSLLKTLEEPSLVNVLILISSRPYQLPMTILSRCQKLRFHPIPADVVARYLEEKIGLDRKTASVLAASSGGSIGRALEMHGESYLARRKQFIEKICEGFSDPMKGILFAGDFGKDRKEIQLRFEILKNWYRDLLVYKETGGTERLIHHDFAEAIQSMAGGMTPSEILRAIDTIEWAYNALEKNANKQLTLEAMTFKLSGQA